MSERLHVQVFLEPNADLSEDWMIQLTATLNVIVRQFGVVRAITVSQVIALVDRPNDAPPAPGQPARFAYIAPTRKM